VFTQVRQGFEWYWFELPDNMVSSIGKSALYSFTASFILTAADTTKTIVLNRPLTAGAVACLAATVHALTNPVFNYIFENKKIIWHQEIVRYVIDYTVTCLLLKQATAYKVHELAFKKSSLFFMSSHMLRLVIDVPLGLVQMVDQEAANQAKTWLTRWGITFKTSVNPTYGVL